MAKTIMMIHGMWGTGGYWKEYKGFFEKLGYKVVTPTLPHHNAKPSSPPKPEAGRIGLVDYVDFLEGEIKELKEKPILMGHSMGGLLAQKLAERDLAEAAILLAPASPRGILALKPSVIRSFLPCFFQWGWWQKPFRQSFGLAVYSMLHLVKPADQKRIYDTFVYESGRVILEIGVWIFDFKKATEVDASKVTCPIFVATGEEDRITPVSVVRATTRRYSQATLKTYPGHAHWVVGEPGWQKIAQDCADWLKENNL